MNDRPGQPPMASSVVVTGGAGSIGSECVRRFVSMGWRVSVMDVSEEGLWALKAALPGVDTCLGDVQSLDDCRAALVDAEYVVHCAALKHVDLCERNPGFARRVNVCGTRNVLDAAGHARVVFVSTDKAIEPVSVMGRTKAEAELLARTRGANVVRFGNVLGSRGSLIPMVKRCSEMKKPVPMTDPRMTRFFMTVKEAIDMIVEGMFALEGGQVIVPEKPLAVGIGKFLNYCVRIIDPTLTIERVGMRPGERLHEPTQLPDGEIAWSNDKRFAATQARLETILRSAGLFTQYYRNHYGEQSGVGAGKNRHRKAVEV